MAASRSWARAAALALGLCACSSVLEEAGFGDAAAIVDRRGGGEILWSRTAEHAAAIDARVAELLRRDLDAEGAVAVALLRNQHLQALYEDLSIAQADLIESGLLGNPIFHVEALFPEGGGRTALDLGLEEQLLSILYLPLRKRVAAASFEATKLRVAEHVLALAGQVRAAFYELQGTEQLAELRRTVVEATEASAELARRLHEAGNIRDLDRDNEVALHAEAKLALARAELERADARERLNALMGLWGQESGWRIATRLPELPAEEETLDGIEGRAVGASLTLAQRRIEIDREAERLGFVRRTRLAADPAVGVSAERESESGQWLIGPSLAVSVPLFNQGQPAVARAAAVMNALQRIYEAEAVELRSAVRRSASRVLAARGRADFLRRVLLPLRSRIVEGSQLEYNAMQAGAFELLMAKREEIEAGASYVEELLDYWVAKAELGQILAGAGPEMQQFAFEESRPLASQSLSTESPLFFLQVP